MRVYRPVGRVFALRCVSRISCWASSKTKSGLDGIFLSLEVIPIFIGVNVSKEWGTFQRSFREYEEGHKVVRRNETYL